MIGTVQSAWRTCEPPCRYYSDLRTMITFDHGMELDRGTKVFEFTKLDVPTCEVQQMMGSVEGGWVDDERYHGRRVCVVWKSRNGVRQLIWKLVGGLWLVKKVGLCSPDYWLLTCDYDSRRLSSCSDIKDYVKLYVIVCVMCWYSFIITTLFRPQIESFFPIANCLSIQHHILWILECSVFAKWELIRSGRNHQRMHVCLERMSGWMQDRYNNWEPWRKWIDLTICSWQYSP